MGCRRQGLFSFLRSDQLIAPWTGWLPGAQIVCQWITCRCRQIVLLGKDARVETRE